MFKKWSRKISANKEFDLPNVAAKACNSKA